MRWTNGGVSKGGISEQCERRAGIRGPRIERSLRLDVRVNVVRISPNGFTGWHDNWDGVRQAIVRDSFISESWAMRPWLFVPRDRVPPLEQRLIQIAKGQPPKFIPKIAHLEMVQPWLYSSWNRKPDCADV